MEEMQKKLEEAEQRVQSLEEEKDKKREKLSAKEEFEEEEIPEDLWERQEYYQVRAKS